MARCEFVLRLVGAASPRIKYDARSPPGPPEGPPGPAEGPSPASPAQGWPRPDFWKFGNLGPGNLEMWDPKNPKIKNLKIKIRVAQNVGKVWISRKKTFPAPFGAIPGIFSMGRKIQKM